MACGTWPPRSSDHRQISPFSKEEACFDAFAVTQHRAARMGLVRITSPRGSANTAAAAAAAAATITSTTIPLGFNMPRDMETCIYTYTLYIYTWIYTYVDTWWDVNRFPRPCVLALSLAASIRFLATCCRQHESNDIICLISVAKGRLEAKNVCVSLSCI